MVIFHVNLYSKRADMHRMFDQIDTIDPAIIPVQWLMALVKKPSHREKFICLNISSLGFNNQRPAMAAYMQVLFTIDVLENESSSFRHVGAFCDILNIHRTHHNTTVLILNLCAESFYPTSWSHRPTRYDV